MDKAQKEGLIARYETTYKPIQERVKALTKEELDFLPSLPDAWSINEHLVHILEADALGWYRFRAAVASPGAKAPGWDQELWRERLRYAKQDGVACLEEAVRLRRFIGAGCRALIDDDWSAYWIEHPAKGRMDLAALLEMYGGHGEYHFPYIDRNLKAKRSMASPVL